MRLILMYSAYFLIPQIATTLMLLHLLNYLRYITDSFLALLNATNMYHANKTISTLSIH